MASKASALTEVSILELEDFLYAVEDPSGTPTSRKVSLARILGLIAPRNDFRLTTESGVPVSSSDRAAQGTLYLTPRLTGATSGLITLFDGTRHFMRKISQISLSLTGLLTNAKPHDFFLDDDGATMSAIAWTDDVTRASALAAEGNLLVLGSDHTKLYLGTGYASGTGTIEDTAAKRWLWNAFNRVRRPLARVDTTNSWTYNGAFRQANNSGANQVDVVVGLNESMVELTALGTANGSTTITYGVGVGLDSTTVNSAQIFAGMVSTMTTGNLAVTAHYRGLPGLGRHFLAWLEKSSAATTTWYGDNNDGTERQSGLVGSIEG